MKKYLSRGAGLLEAIFAKLWLKTTTIVFSLDNYSTGSELNHIDGVNYIQGDTKNIEDLINFTPDLVYHLGEYSRVEQSFEDITKVWEYNKVGTFAVLCFCRKHACKIIYAGSSTKFGDGGLGRNQSPYGWTKASNTELVENFGEWYNIPYAIVYFYNAYGPREINEGKYATLIGLFKTKMRAGKKLTVFRPGDKRRNFTHVNDIVNGIILVGANGYGDGFGIGHPTSYSVLEVASMFGGEIEMLPERPGNRMGADVISEKTIALGWKPVHNLEEYIDTLKMQNWEYID